MHPCELVRRFYEIVVSQHLLEQLPEYLSSDCMVRDGERLVPAGIDGMAEHLTALRRTYPDYTMRITRQFTDGEYVISEFVMRGTHGGLWLGIQPTGRVLEFNGVDIDRVRDGRIIEHGDAVTTLRNAVAAGADRAAVRILPQNRRPVSCFSPLGLLH